ncbi:sulfatase-like hydrolase/transferase [Phycisphaeraceae bacterium D3-23]
MRFLLSLLILTYTLCLGCLTAPAQAQDRPPNIILIFCDDLGYGDIGVFWQNDRALAGQPAHATPHIDRMAEQGVQMAHAYCPAPVCAPSRASLMLGVTQGHANVRDNQFDKALEDNHTLASVLGEAGYATAAFGKWGLQGNAGPNIENGFVAHPMNRGFDYFLGYMRHRDGHRHYPLEDGKELYDGDTNIADQLALCYTTDLFTARSKKWIVDHVEATPGEPFFVYLAYDTPHAILQNPPCAYPDGGGLDGGAQWLGEPGTMINTATGDYDAWVHPDYTDQDWPEQYIRYANGVRRIDDSVGDILRLLEDLDIDDNTLVIFTTDNGPSAESYLQGKPYSPEFFHSYGPFDGIKRDLWEGGIRTGAIAQWAGTIPAGTVSATPLTFADFLATFTDAAGVPVPARSDGVSLLPAMTAHGEQAPANIYIEYANNGRTPGYRDFESSHAGRRRAQMQAIRLGDHVGVRYNIQSHDDPFEIYHIVDDPKQTTDLAGRPNMVALQQLMHDEVLRRRVPNASATRPYDDVPIPAVAPRETEPGLNLQIYRRTVSYVPRVENTDPIHGHHTAQPELIETRRNATQCFTGYLVVPETGAYTLRLSTPGRAILRLHHATWIDADRPFVAGQAYEVTVRLEQGLHPIQLSLNTARGTDTNGFALSWSGPGFDMKPIEPEAWAR